MTIQEYFRRMADEGCQIVVMEVSSQGLIAGTARPVFRF